MKARETEHIRRQEPNAPTPERRAIANGTLKRMPVYDSPNNRVIIAYGHIIVQPIRKLFEANLIGEQEIEAASILQKDHFVGMRAAGLIASYGERGCIGGTPPSQQAETEGMNKEERRTYHHDRYLKACNYIGRDEASWLTAIVCDVQVEVLGKSPSFEDIGRWYGGYGNRPQAKASGESYVRTWLKNLTRFYSTR
jgi:hypothetical protein